MHLFLTFTVSALRQVKSAVWTPENWGCQKQSLEWVKVKTLASCFNVQKRTALWKWAPEPGIPLTRDGGTLRAAGGQVENDRLCSERRSLWERVQNEFIWGRWRDDTEPEEQAQTWYGKHEFCSHIFFHFSSISSEETNPPPTVCSSCCSNWFWSSKLLNF